MALVSGTNFLSRAIIILLKPKLLHHLYSLLRDVVETILICAAGPEKNALIGLIVCGFEKSVGGGSIPNTTYQWQFIKV